MTDSDFDEAPESISLNAGHSEHLDATLKQRKSISAHRIAEKSRRRSKHEDRQRQKLDNGAERAMDALPDDILQTIQADYGRKDVLLASKSMQKKPSVSRIVKPAASSRLRSGYVLSSQLLDNAKPLVPLRESRRKLVVDASGKSAIGSRFSRQAGCHIPYSFRRKQSK